MKEVIWHGSMKFEAISLMRLRDIRPLSWGLDLYDCAGNYDILELQ